jgi:riboflavin kinase/FMN adenylyltransferase
MEITGSLTGARSQLETVLTIGAFDGLHHGHQALVRAVVAQADDTDRLSAVITFYPHPGAVLAPKRSVRYLTTPAEKAVLLEAMGVDLLVLLAFDRQMADTSAYDFMLAVSRQLRVRELWIGSDFALGRSREGDAAHLSEVGRELGFKVRVGDPVRVDGRVVSSSRIRDSLGQGRVEEATRLLGRYPSVSGRVGRGILRDWDPGLATACLELCQGRALPAEGVYAAFVGLGKQRYPAVANVAALPRWDEGQRIVGVHIFQLGNEQASYDRIYGCDLSIEFVSQLRPARQPRDAVDLSPQTESDIKDALRAFERIHPAARHLDATSASGSLPSQCPYRYLEVEHTADRALGVWGNHLPDLYVGAAQGMYSLMADLDGLVATTWRRVRLEDWDRESLLVNWLNELLFLTETEGFLLVECQIESLTDTELVARVGGVPGSVNKASIKAATFHDLTLAREDHGWATVITFDV